MATKKISEMTAATTLGGSELIPIVQAGSNRTATPTLVMEGTRPTYITLAGDTIRIGIRSGGFVIDKVIGGTGFLGTEGADWENIGGAS